MPSPLPPPVWPRRALLAAAAGTITPTATVPLVRLGTLAYGTVCWVAAVIRRHRLDRAHGVRLQTETLANNGAAKVALFGGAVDLIVSDWLFVAAGRARGVDFSFAPFSAATGALVLGRDSGVRSLAGLAGRRLGVAGGPYDKSWLILRARALQQGGPDPAHAADVVYAAPPLLGAKLRQGELDAVLTYWDDAAALEVAGFRQLTSVAACARGLGLPADLPILGYVFDRRWALRQPHRIAGFLAASAAAEAILLHSPAEWNALRPLMGAPDDRLFARLRRGFLAGITHPAPAAEARAAAQLFAILRRLGGGAATGGLTHLPPDVFWSLTS
jgi:NitT/TauT family transport system substrate-binding protein